MDTDLRIRISGSVIMDRDPRIRIHIKNLRDPEHWILLLPTYCCNVSTGTKFIQFKVRLDWSKMGLVRFRFLHVS
jgi:hypothetical protein